MKAKIGLSKVNGVRTPRILEAASPSRGENKHFKSNKCTTTLIVDGKEQTIKIF
jgi:hypothetical protein